MTKFRQSDYRQTASQIGSQIDNMQNSDRLIKLTECRHTTESTLLSVVYYAQRKQTGSRENRQTSIVFYKKTLDSTQRTGRRV